MPEVSIIATILNILSLLNILNVWQLSNNLTALNVTTTQFPAAILTEHTA
jgi:hypothetical protein